MKPLQSAILLLIISSSTLFADWRTDIGWDHLQEWATMNDVTLPNTSTVHIGMTEAIKTKKDPDDPAITYTGYAPDPASSQLSDVNISDVSQVTVDIYSEHA